MVLAVVSGSQLEDNQPAVIIDEWPHSWPNGEITYRLNNLTSDIVSRRNQIRAVTVAFRAWQLRVKNIRFRRVYDSFSYVDINISFQPLSKFNNMKSVLGLAYFPGQGNISGDIEINDEWDWVPSAKWQTLAKPPLVAVLIHEIGHSLGLRHDTSNNQAIMYPSFDLGKPKNHLHENDITRIQNRYGKRTISQRLIDYFKNRRLKGYDFK